MRSVQETKGSTYLKDRKWSGMSGADKSSKRKAYHMWGCLVTLTRAVYGVVGLKVSMGGLKRNCRRGTGDTA